MTAPLDRLKADLGAALDRLGEALREPKSDIVRDAAFQIGLIEDDEQVFQMLEDRNRTSHLYNAAMAEDVFSRIPAHHALMSGAAGRL